MIHHGLQLVKASLGSRPPPFRARFNYAVGGKHLKNGEGLGLSITWGRPGVDAMQGAMWVESTAMGRIHNVKLERGYLQSGGGMGSN